MTPIRYADGSLSREVEESKPRMSILDIRDALNDLADLVDVMRAALLTNEACCPTKVASCLYINVYERIKELEKELAKQ